MDDAEFAQADIADVPTTFDSAAILLVREDDEWARGVGVV